MDFIIGQKAEESLLDVFIEFAKFIFYVHDIQYWLIKKMFHISHLLRYYWLKLLNKCQNSYCILALSTIYSFILSTCSSFICNPNFVRRHKISSAVLAHSS